MIEWQLNDPQKIQLDGYVNNERKFMITDYGNRLYCNPIEIDDHVGIYILTSFLTIDTYPIFNTLPELKKQAEFLIQNESLFLEYEKIKENSEKMYKEWLNSEKINKIKNYLISIAEPYS